MIIWMENETLRVAVNTQGGHIEEISGKADGSGYYWSYDPTVWPRRTSVCFPICGALPDGSYTYQGNRYEMPMHGFLREQNLTVRHQSARELCLEATQTPETLRIYSFAFVFQIYYELLGRRLQVTYRVSNPSPNESLVFAVGSHYTYQVPIRQGERLEDYSLAFSPFSEFTQLHLEDGLVSQHTSSFQWKTGMPLNELDKNGSVLLRCPSQPEEHTVSLENAKTGSRTAVTFRGFDYCVLWRPFPDAPFVCIEPWSSTPEKVGNTGALESKHAMTELAPGDEKCFSLSIEAE